MISSVFFLPESSFESVLPSQLLEESRSTKVKIVKRYPVTRLDLENQHVILANGQKIQYDKVLVATGGKPKRYL
jgi:NADPH-dependent 2,4-dienoyl-CoA reductase/sulfur reductase-like enzyme